MHFQNILCEIIPEFRVHVILEIFPLDQEHDRILLILLKYYE